MHSALNDIHTKCNIHNDENSYFVSIFRFQVSQNQKKRHTENYKTQKAKTDRLQLSAIQYMQNIMYQHDEKIETGAKQKMLE